MERLASLYFTCRELAWKLNLNLVREMMLDFIHVWTQSVRGKTCLLLCDSDMKCHSRKISFQNIKVNLKSGWIKWIVTWKCLENPEDYQNYFWPFTFQYDEIQLVNIEVDSKRCYYDSIFVFWADGVGAVGGVSGVCCLFSR